MKKRTIILIIVCGLLFVVTFVSVTVVLVETLVKSSGAYKESVIFLETDSTIKNHYGNITGVGVIVIGGVEEESRNGIWSGSANLYYSFMTPKGQYHISIELTEDNAPWKVTEYRIS